MANEKKIFLEYPPERDVVFVFGAGTSYSDGVPLQRQILPMIVSGFIPEIVNSELGKIVNEFIRDNFHFDAGKKIYPSMEAVFGYLDYFIEHQESLNSKYNYSKLVDIKEYLIILIHFVVNMRSDENSRYYHSFWESITKHNPNIAIITLNYDTLLEHSFEYLYGKFGYIDYCLHFMNYEHDKRVKNFNFWINPREPVPAMENTFPVPLKIIKLHGSLNWKYCNCCNQILLTPWDRNIDLNRGKFLGYTYPDKEEYEYSCPLDSTDFRTLIIPPSYLKSIKPPVISSLLNEAGREIRVAKKIVFVGYSLSDPDIQIKALFKKQINPETEIIVINPKDSEAFKSKYKALLPDIKFVHSTFEEMVSDDHTMAELLSK